MEHIGTAAAVDVSAGTDDELLTRLGAVGIPLTVRERIVKLRGEQPFSSLDDCVQRVNAAAAQLNERLGKKQQAKLCWSVGGADSTGTASTAASGP